MVQSSTVTDLGWLMAEMVGLLVDRVDVEVPVVKVVGVVATVGMVGVEAVLLVAGQVLQRASHLFHM